MADTSALSSALGALAASLTTLEADVRTTVPVHLTPTVTGPQFLQALADPSVTVIELAAGDYSLPDMNVHADRATLVTVRPAPAATPVFHSGVWSFGGSDGSPSGGRASKIRMQDIVWDGLSLGSTGIMWLGNVADITLNHMTVRNCTGVLDQSWALYVSGWNSVAGPVNVTADDWIVTGDHKIGGCQIYHAPGAQGVHLRNWKVRHCGYVVYANNASTGVEIAGWQADSCAKSIWLNAITGTIRDCAVTNSQAPAHQLDVMTDLGGNTWA